MITDTIISQLKKIIEELEVLDEFLMQFAEEEIEEEEEEEEEEDSDLPAPSDRRTDKERKSITDIFKEKME